MCLTWHSNHVLLTQCLDSFSLGSAFLHRVRPAGGLPHPQDKWAHWQLTDPHPWLLKTPEPSPFTSPPFPKESAWPSAQWKISKRRKRQNKRRLLFWENLQPSNTSIVSFMLFSFVPPLFVGQNVVELTTKTYLSVHSYKWLDLGYQCQRNSISQRCRETTQKCHLSHFDCVVGNEWEHYFKCQRLEGKSHKERSVFCFVFFSLEKNMKLYNFLYF